MAEFVDKLLDSFDKTFYSWGIFIDSSRVFDTVNQLILLKKLYYYGVENQNL